MIERKSVNLVSRPNGPPTLENFELVTSSLDEIKDGQVLLKTIYLSLDPYMRGRMNADKSYADPVPVGGVMEGECVAEVIDSKNLNYKVGDIVAARIGWVTHAICDGTDAASGPLLSPSSWRISAHHQLRQGGARHYLQRC